MSIFGKKSNQPTPELPPELRPFYGQQKASSLKTGRWLAIITLGVIVAVAVLFGLWLHGRNTSVHQPKPSTQLSTSTNGNHSTNVHSPSPSTTQTNPVKSAQTTPSTTQPNPAGSSQSTPATTAPNAAIPNTGPGTNVLLASIGAGLLGAILYHIRQLRATSKIR
jgi:cytoskeletal protein RodZ